MKPESNHSVSVLFGHWKQEHSSLQQELDAFRDWTSGIAEQPSPEFIESANRLRQIRDRLVDHFVREDQIGRQLRSHYPKGSLEVEASYRQACQDHEELLSELDDLAERLDQVEPPFGTWADAVHEVSLFIDRLEEHEECEAEHIQWLAPREDTAV
ncbi:hemerythrin domain-containing protein [Novipirellula rosea]|mgnify:CR=1 FL=1|uniref:Hemerythrin-like domain-containing protein n=1 Tax=Novipirellula rosea TaxID=1031540 RepID=A0ABP8N3H3_9BACT|tara:strand:- start:31498 stop:31965 length:468 start_codon:yes stop_codon:yes gene_type:complete